MCMYVCMYVYIYIYIYINKGHELPQGWTEHSLGSKTFYYHKADPAERERILRVSLHVQLAMHLFMLELPIIVNCVIASCVIIIIIIIIIMYCFNHLLLP